MGVPNNSLHELERQRLELEGNISKLQDSLYHWRTWEAEYDGLKEEINELGDDATIHDYLQVGRDFGGSLVNEDEVKVILGEKQGVTRTKQQVVDLVTRRIDYVKQNAATMEKRLRAAEDKLYALDSQDQLPAEPTAEFPMTEIFEELDENGDVISSKVTTPGSQAPDLLEVLKKAGVKDIPDVVKADTSAPSSSQSTAQTTEEVSSTGAHESISEGPPTSSSRGNAPEAKPVALDPTIEVHGERPVIEVDESPEDAQLRREMLQYSLNEVGSVVAELELDEGASDISVDDDYGYDFDDDDEEEEEEEEEDEYGRTTGRVLSEDYHRQMRELEQKLNARGMWNAGKDTESLPTDVKQDLEQPSVVHVEKTADTSSEPVEKKKPKKKVAFADDLDIAPAPKPPTAEKKAVPVRESNVPVLSDSVVERTGSVDKVPVKNDAPKKVSRFKTARKTETATEEATASASQSSSSSRSAEPRSALRKTEVSSTVSSLPLFPAKPAEPKPFSQPISDVIEKDPTPRGPEGKILADTLVERETPAGSAVAPEPDELDEQLHKKEIATEFYRIRNRMVQQNGGFVGEEPEIVPIETEDAPRRVSRFKAARTR